VLYRKAFTPSAPAGQVFVIAFVQDTAAIVTLTANVNPNAPWKDQLVIKLKGAPGNQEHWLLVVECPRQTSFPQSGGLYSEAVQQMPAPYMTVAAHFGVGPSSRFKLGCFSPPAKASKSQSPLTPPGYATIASVTLPALETDQDMQAAQATSVLYAEHNTSVGPASLIRVFRGAVCPSSSTQTAQTTTSPVTSSPSPGTSASESLQPGSPSAGNVTRSPEPGSPGCYIGALAGTKFSEYNIPTFLQTREVLKDVNLTGYQVESIFPAAQVKRENGKPGHAAGEAFTWSGASGLSPSLIVTDVKGARAASRNTFLAGIFFGIAAGILAPFLERVWAVLFRKEEAKKEDRKDTDTSIGEDDKPGPQATRSPLEDSTSP